MHQTQSSARAPNKQSIASVPKEQQRFTARSAIFGGKLNGDAERRKIRKSKTGKSRIDLFRINRSFGTLEPRMWDLVAAASKMIATGSSWHLWAVGAPLFRTVLAKSLCCAAIFRHASWHHYRFSGWSWKQQCPTGWRFLRRTVRNTHLARPARLRNRKWNTGKFILICSPGSGIS